MRKFMTAAAISVGCLALMSINSSRAEAAGCQGGHYDAGNTPIVISQGPTTMTCNVRVTAINPTFTNFEGTCQTENGGVTDRAFGNIKQNRAFHLTANWHGGPVGIYTGFVEDDGTISDGRTFDQSNTQKWSTWSLKRGTVLKCATP